jgi:hypothetical protein
MHWRWQQSRNRCTTPVDDLICIAASFADHMAKVGTIVPTLYGESLITPPRRLAETVVSASDCPVQRVPRNNPTGGGSQL